MATSPDTEHAQRADIQQLDDVLWAVDARSEVERRRQSVDGAIALLDAATGQRPRLMPAPANTLFHLAASCAEPQRDRLLSCVARDTGLSRDALRVLARREAAIAQSEHASLSVADLRTLVADMPPFASPFGSHYRPAQLPARSVTGLTPAGWFLFSDLARSALEYTLRPAPDQWSVTRQLWRHPDLRAAMVGHGATVLFADGTAIWGDPAMVGEALEVLGAVYPYLPRTLANQAALCRWLERVAAVAPLTPWMAVLASGYILDADEAWNLVRERRRAYPDAAWPVEVWTPWLQHENPAIRTEAVTLVAWPATPDAGSRTTERVRTR